MPSRLNLLGLLCLVVAVPASVGYVAAHSSSAGRARLHQARHLPQRSRILNDRRRSAHRSPQTVIASQPAPICHGLSGRTLAISTDKAVHLGLKTYPETLDLHDHEVVLTFDDGPSPATTPAVLNALRQECVRATFFLIGRNAAAYSPLVQRELAEGHTLGHHSMTHPSVTLRGLDEGAAKADIDAGVAADEKAAYGDAVAGAPRVPFFRFPGFADTKPLLDDLDSKHFAVFGADLWAADWLPMSPDAERERVIDLLERSPRHAGIILFHDTKLSTARMMPAFLSDLRNKGYKVVHMMPATRSGEPTKLFEAPKGWSSETEAIIAHVRPDIMVGAHRRFRRRQGSPLAGSSRGAQTRKVRVTFRVAPDVTPK